MSKEILDIRVVDLLEQIQEVDKLIHLYSVKANDIIAMSMIKQYSVRREEFVEQLNLVFNKFSLQLILLEPIGINRNKYAPEILMPSFAHEPLSDYKTKDSLTELEGVD